MSAAMLGAVRNLVESLNDGQRAQATWAFDDDERRTWFYTPTDHGGLTLGEMTASQQQLVWQVLAAALSTPAYNTVVTIVGLENILDRVEGFSARFGRERGRNPELYWFAVFGTPGPSGTWGWRFGGHHVSLNFTIHDGDVVATTPCFMGADPASLPLLGPHLLRPLGAAEDLGFELVRSLTKTQAAAAVVSATPPPDIIGVNRTELTDGDRGLALPLLWRGRLEDSLDALMARVQTNLEAQLGATEDEVAQLAFTTRARGLSAADMSGDQQEVFRALLDTYVGRIHDDLADAQAARYAGDNLHQLHFMWAGSTEPGAQHYYRVQGGDLFIEYDKAQRDGNHVHTVWRDLKTDFGGDPLAQHYTDESGHHH